MIIVKENYVINKEGTYLYLPISIDKASDLLKTEIHCTDIHDPIVIQIINELFNIKVHWSSYVAVSDDSIIMSIHIPEYMKNLEEDIDPITVGLIKYHV